MTRGVGNSELLFPGPGLGTKRLGSALTLCSSALPSSPLSSHPSPAREQGLPWLHGGICCSSCFSGASLAGGLLSWAQPTAHPEGHLLLNFTIAQAYGLQSPSPTRWRAEDLLRSGRVLEPRNDSFKKMNFIHVARMDSGRWSRSRCYPS